RHFDPVAFRLRHPGPVEIDLPRLPRRNFDGALVLRRTEFGQRGHLFNSDRPVAADLNLLAGTHLVSLTGRSVDLRRAAGDPDFSIPSLSIRVYARFGLAVDAG